MPQGKKKKLGTMKTNNKASFLLAYVIVISYADSYLANRYFMTEIVVNSTSKPFNIKSFLLCSKFF